MKHCFFLLLNILTSKAFCQVETSPTDFYNSYAVVIPDTNDLAYKLKDHSSTTLLYSDYHIIDSLVRLCIHENGQESSQKPYRNRIGNCEYVKQLVPFKNEKGQKSVWVNCICKSEIEAREKELEAYQKVRNKKKMYGPTYKGWRNRIMTYDDGGNCFWNIRVNLETLTYSYLDINGPQGNCDAKPFNNEGFHLYQKGSCEFTNIKGNKKAKIILCRAQFYFQNGEYFSAIAYTKEAYKESTSYELKYQILNLMLESYKQINDLSTVSELQKRIDTMREQMSGH